MRRAWAGRAAIAAGVALALAAAGCEANRRDRDPAGAGSRPDRPPREEGRARPQTVAPSHCPTGVPECATAEGEIFYVERVDPDGDGDAHFVIFDGQSITLPGITAIDVRRGLRPHPLPGPGDVVSAAGPVQTGSYGQSQIHALEFHVAGG
jgi:hypothetical protein